MMNKFMYGKTYVIERTNTRVMAFELISRGENYIEVYIREYTPEINELEGFEVRLHVTNDGVQEFVNYKKDIPASQHYDGKISIFTKEGLKNYDEQTN